RYELWRSANGRAWRRVLSTRANQRTLTGRRGSSYRFVTIAIDRRGNREAMPGRADVVVRIARR
ncbi:MAG TPA: hypothetical protein VD931_21210, partial [Baekduia sp.]|nr:hypothetical protein [Baekduia sp.]